jgi:hypothetical protein
MKKLLLLSILLLCACNKWTRPDPSDSISYRAIGSSIVGTVLIDYSTPTNGVVSTSSTLVVPFTSGTIAGYSQYINTKPALTISILQTGCVEAQILINAVVVEHKSQCGPTTFTIKH